MNNQNLYNMRPSQKYNDGLIQLVDFISEKSTKSTLNMIEIGSYAGQSMEIFAKTGKIKLFACIDPWQKGYDDHDAASNTDMELAEKLFDDRLNSLKKSVNIIKHKGTIETFVKSQEYKNFLEIGDLDFVYIDGNHTYEYCKNDILVCKDILKPKIAIAGHDIKYPDVKNAVEETIGSPDRTFVDSSWCKIVF